MKKSSGHSIDIHLILTLGICTSLLFSSCLENKRTANTPVKGLKDYYQEYFPIGVAVSSRALKDPLQSKLILQHFNSMTPENDMKMGPIHPINNLFNWGPADDIMTYADSNNLMLRGHTLCWHNQTPKWIFADSIGNQVSKEVLLERLKEHIQSVVTRYQKKIYAWDVVNEAVSDKKEEFLRPSKWLEIIGEEYIAKAFEYAHEADPDAKLFYNDYNVIDPVKRNKIVQLVNDLKDKGVPIHGVGIQGHWSVYEPDRETLVNTIESFENLGLLVQVTELDVSVYPKEHSAREPQPEDKNDAFTSVQKLKQIDQYKMFFEVFREKKEVLTSVTFWNISDQHSWLDNFPVRGRKDYPLLFDEQLKPKEAYDKVVNF